MNSPPPPRSGIFPRPNLRVFESSSLGSIRERSGFRLDQSFFVPEPGGFGKLVGLCPRRLRRFESSMGMEGR